MKRIQTGIESLDKRTGGIRAGGIYVIAGVPGSGKLPCVLQFINTGILAGESVALLTGTHPEQVFEQAAHMGFRFEEAWKQRQLRMLRFTDNFERLLLRAADPDEVFAELTASAGTDVARLGIDPGKPLWETRAGTALGSRFVNWAESSSATTWATLGSDLNDTVSPATEWVLQTASGVLKIERQSDGVHQLWIRRMSPPPDSQSAISLELVPGGGLQQPTGTLDRRRTDAPAGAERRLLLLKLAAELPHEISGWARGQFDVVESDQPLSIVAEIQEGTSFGVVLIYVDRKRSSEAVAACRALRPLTSAPIILVADDRLRATDRTNALDAGANDFLSDSFSIVELASRIDRAIESTRGLPHTRRSRETPAAGAAPTALEQTQFIKTVVERLNAEDGSMFTLILVEPGADVADSATAVMLEQVRWDVGDFVGKVDGMFGVVLQGARPAQADAFFGRVRESLQRGGVQDPELALTVLNSATDADQILDLLKTDSS
jgi:CheY-like chemotaxis protein